MNELPQLNEETIKEYWSKTYNKDGKPDWSHIFPFYHEEIVFKDSIQEVRGFTDFEAMCKRLTKRTKSLEMDLLNIVKKDNIILMEWIMTMSFRRSPKSQMFGATRLTLHQDGRILEQRDYYDLWGDIYDNIPGWRRLYRWFMSRFFG